MELRAAERHLRQFAGYLPVQAGEALARVKAQGVPVSVLDGLTDALPAALAVDERWCAAAREDAEKAERLVRAQRTAGRALARVSGVALSDSVLGPAWSADVDVYCSPAALEPAGRALRGAGAVPVDPLQAVLGGNRAPTAGTPARHFAIVEAGEVIGPAELVTELWTGGASAAVAVARARAGDGPPRLAAPDVALRRLGKLAAARRVTVRGLAELVTLLEDGVPLPAGLARGVLRRYVELERSLAGPGVLARAVEAAPRRPGAAVVWTRARMRAVRREARGHSRRGQVRIAFCGVDGAGKSTQVELLVENLERGDVRARASWTRLGNKASGPVEGLARLAQRLLPSGTHSYEAVRAEAGRREPSAPVTVSPPLTRRGVIGWSWALAVTVDYVLRARAARRRASGCVLVLDRALPDALVELEDNYGVALRLGLQRRLLERWSPQPDVVFYLRLPGAVAKARKDDTFTALELESHRERYEELLQTLPGVVTLDAQRSRTELAAEVLRRVSAAEPSGSVGPSARP